MAVIKIDEELLKKVRRYIKERDNRFDYPTVKAFTDKAVYTYLKKIMKGKKGQVSFFIIIGIVVLFTFAIIFYFNLISHGTNNSDIQTINSFESSITRIKNFVELCLKDTSTGAIDYIGEHGGYYNLKDKFITNSQIVNTTYFFYLGNNLMPSKETVEGEISDYINDNIHLCLRKFNPFLEEGFKIEVGNVKSSTILNKNKAFFSLEFPLTIKRGPHQKKLTDFSTPLDTKFGLMFDIASILTREQTNDPDNICMDCLYGGASKNNLTIELSNIYNDTVIFSILDNNTGEQLIYANKYAIYSCSNPPIDADSSFLIDCLNEKIMDFNYQFQVENIPNMNATVHESFHYKVKAIGLNLTFEDYSPLFIINEKTGIISFIPSEEQIGNHTIWIYIRDGLGNKKYIDFNLKIIKNE